MRPEPAAGDRVGAGAPAAAPADASTSPSTLRLFLALELPDEVRTELAAWRDRALAGRGDLRPVAAEALHVTLAFFGHRPERDAARVADIAFAAAGDLRPPTLCPRAVHAVPPRRPRLFALDLEDEDGRAGELQAAVAAALSGAGLLRPERRAFWPHVTLARVRGRGGQAVAGLDGRDLPAQPFAAARLTLYRSLLRREGARYQPLERLELRAG